MAKEIERKFLVTDDSYKAMSRSSVDIVQAYLSTRREATVRVRLWGDRGVITVKGATDGCTRDEWEYDIPADDARRMAALAVGQTIVKRRWFVDWKGYTWEVDEFGGDLAGLTVAEVEMEGAGCDPALPPFVGREVTGEPAYYNSALALSDTLPEIR